MIIYNSFQKEIYKSYADTMDMKWLNGKQPPSYCYK